MTIRGHILVFEYSEDRICSVWKTSLAPQAFGSFHERCAARDTRVCRQDDPPKFNTKWRHHRVYADVPTCAQQTTSYRYGSVQGRPLAYVLCITKPSLTNRDSAVRTVHFGVPRIGYFRLILQLSRLTCRRRRRRRRTSTERRQSQIIGESQFHRIDRSDSNKWIRISLRDAVAA